MMIISFSWTTDAFLANRKDVTRRAWSHAYARRFKEGDLCKAYDKQPRFGGKQIGLLKIKSITFEDISTMDDFEDFEKEGFAYMEEKGLKIWGKNPRQAFEDWKKEGGYYWVISFRKIKGE